MDDLTLEQAERCARALKYERDKEVICEASDGTAQTEPVWIDPSDGMGYYTLPRDPYYWFPRLWDRLEEVHKKDTLGFALYSGYRIHSGERSCWVSPDSYAAPPSINPCLALCEAIEALEGK